MNSAAPSCKVSFSILIYNSADTIESCLKAIFDTEHGQSGEVWLVDNGSRDGGLELVKSNFPQVKVIDNKVNEFFAVHNKVISQANGMYTLILNPDVLLNDKSINIMVDYLDKNTDTVGVGPLHKIPTGAVERTARLMAKPQDCLWSGTVFQVISPSRRQHSYDRVTSPSLKTDSKEEVLEVEVLQDSCLLVRTSSLQSVGGYDPAFKLYYTEDDLCKRLKEKGKLAYLKNCEVEHFLSTSVRKEKPFRIRKIMFMDMLTYLRKHFGILIYLAFLPLVYISMASWWLAKAVGVGKGKFSIRG